MLKLTHPAMAGFERPVQGAAMVFSMPSENLFYDISCQNAQLLTRHLQGANHDRTTFGRHMDFCFSAVDKKWRCRIFSVQEKGPNGKRLDFKKHLEKKHRDLCEKLQSPFVF